MSKLVRVGITQGDPNGVGYEIIMKTVAREGGADLFTPVIFGKAALAEKAKVFGEVPGVKINVIKNASEAVDGKINLVDLPGAPIELKPGKVDKEAGKSAVDALEAAVEALKANDIDVLVTAPISKEAVQSDNFNFPGHTEYLTARLGEGEDALMLLCNDTLRVGLLTKHIPLTSIGQHISKERVVDYVKKFTRILKQDFGIVRPTVAVLSLNPHAGDGGLLGTEEEEIIKPALKELVEEGYLAFGPFAADGFFGHGSYKNYDGVLAMYHDQGLAPFKTIATSGGVNFSGGLPYVRTSPDHGTAFDIAWSGKADPASMKDAIYMAIDIFRRRKAFEEAGANPLKKYVHERPERLDRKESKTEIPLHDD